MAQLTSCAKNKSDIIKTASISKQHAPDAETEIANVSVNVPAPWANIIVFMMKCNVSPT